MTELEKVQPDMKLEVVVLGVSDVGYFRSLLQEECGDIHRVGKSGLSV